MGIEVATTKKIDLLGNARFGDNRPVHVHRTRLSLLPEQVREGGWHYLRETLRRPSPPSRVNPLTIRIRFVHVGRATHTERTASRSTSLRRDVERSLASTRSLPTSLRRSIIDAMARVGITMRLYVSLFSPCPSFSRRFGILSVSSCGIMKRDNSCRFIRCCFRWQFFFLLLFAPFVFFLFFFLHRNDR